MVMGLLIVGAIGFFVGHQYGERRVAASQWAKGSESVIRKVGIGKIHGEIRARLFDRDASGEITKIDGGTVMLDMGNGVNRDITLNSDTAVRVMMNGSVEDLSVGDLVKIYDGGLFHDIQTIIVKPK